MARALITFALLAGAATLDLTLLPEEKYGSVGGRCLDGTMAGYYYGPPASGKSSVVVIYLQGGGGCTTKADCDKRAFMTLGSSANWTKTMSDQQVEVHSGRILWSDSKSNPDFADAHHLFIPYCSSDFYSGQVTKPSSKTWGYYFSGHLNLQWILQHVAKAVPQIQAVDQVLLIGSSAGGLGTFINCDWINDEFTKYMSHSVSVKCAPIGGWFYPGFTEDHSDSQLPPSLWPDWSNGKTTSGAAWEMQFQDIKDVYQGYHPVECANAFGAADAWKCSSATNMYPHVKTPMYVLENQFDCDQIQDGKWANNGLDLPVKLAGMEQGNEYISYFGRAMRNSTRQVVSHPSGKVGDGLFHPSCFEHTNNMKPGRVESSVVKGFTSAEALADWFYGRGKIPAVLIDDKCEMQGPGLPCNPTCNWAPTPVNDCSSNFHQFCGDYMNHGQTSACLKCAQKKQSRLQHVGCSTADFQRFCRGSDVVV